jgi:hypothetical protein
VLQDTIPPGRALRVPEARTDLASGPIAAPGAGGARDGRDPPDGTEAEAAPRGAREPAAPTPADDERSGPMIQPDPSPGAANRALDPPPRPVHDADEVTPPATDLAELQRTGSGSGDRGSSS